MPIGVEGFRASRVPVYPKEISLHSNVLDLYSYSITKARSGIVYNTYHTAV